MNDNTIGIYHRNPDQCSIKFDPVARADKLKRHREFYSHEKWDVRAFVYEGEQHTGPYTWARKDVDKACAETGFWPHFRHMLGGKGKPCGQGQHGGTQSVSYDQFNCGKDGDTTLHELIHNGLGDGVNGIGHSHELRSNGQITQMGDQTSLMGSGEGEGLISPIICALGWHRESETIVIEVTQQVLVCATEMAGLHPNEYKHVIIRVKGYNDFYLSLRQPYPFDLGDRNAPRDRLYIHEMLPKGHPDIEDDSHNSTLLHEALGEADSVTLPNGVFVDYLSDYGGVSRVEVLFKTPDISEHVFAHNTLPAFGAPIESGCYYNPVSNGHGFDVHTHDNQTVIYWYTGNEDNDNPRYYFATGEAGAELDLWTTEGGTVDNPSGAVEVKVGTIRATGNVFAWRLNGVRGGTEVEQLVIPTTSGIYYYEPRKGEGITVQEWDGGCAVFFYTYKGNKQAWYSCEGVWNGAFYDLVAYETMGKFMREKLTTTPCGKGQLVRLETGQVRFSFQADGRDETYVMDLLF